MDNIFLAVARSLWIKGEDGELIVRDMAKALKAVIEYGKGDLTPEELSAEISRLLAL